MGLRIASLESVRREPATPEEWGREVERVVATAGAHMQAGPQGIAGAFAEVDGWSDPQRAYQARCRLGETAIGATQGLSPDRWIPIYETAASCLLDALASDPAEPTLLNLTGILLYEVWELAGADALFDAAFRLDPELSGIRGNRKAVKERRRLGRVRPKGANAARQAALGARAKRVAAAAKPATGLTLSLCMIVKDEEEMLPGCLEAVAPYVDEIVVVDTGSSDRTVEIAESFGAKIVEVPWNGSFADARNVSLEHATGDWVMYLDADEHLVPEDAPRLRDALGWTWREMFDLVETNYTGGDDSGSAVTHLALRIWRNRPQYRFEGRIHEQKTGNMPTYLPERLGHTGVRMLHYGYLKSRIGAKDKSTRNIELLQQEVRESPKPFALFNLASEYMVLGRWVEARELFDRAWVDVRLEEDWRAIGYVPLLAPRMVTCRRETGKLAEARVGARQALLAYPDHTDVALQLALVERGAGNLDEARRIAERCLEMGDAPAAYSAVVGSGTYLALCLLGELATARGELEEAEELFRRSLRDYPHYVSPILPLAVTMLRRGATPAEVLAEVPEGKPSALLLAATACFEAGHAEEPETWFRTVLERQPANAVARLGRAESLIALKRYAEAADESALALDSALGPQAASVRLFALAAAQDARGLRAALASAFAAGMTAHEAQIFGAWAAVIEGAPLPRTLPADAAATALLGLDALLRVQDFEVFEQLAGLYQATLAPARQKVEDLARLYLRRGFLESAADEWLPFAQRGGDAKAFVGLAQVAFAKGLHEDALELAREALRLDPGSVEPQRLVRSLESRIATAA